MRHRVFGKHLGRSTGQRNALRRTLITQFFEHERITTTRAKAEAIRGEAEEMITKAKNSLTHSDPGRKMATYRLMIGRLDSETVANKLMNTLAPRYQNRPGGYTRVYKLGPRKGDGAEMVILELVDRPDEDDDAAPSTTQRLANTGRNLLGRFGRRGNQGNQENQGGESAE
jgi:large subunit ribosomal protein L17